MLLPLLFLFIIVILSPEVFLQERIDTSMYSFATVAGYAAIEMDLMVRQTVFEVERVAQLSTMLDQVLPAAALTDPRLTDVGASLMVWEILRQTNPQLRLVSEVVAATQDVCARLRAVAADPQSASAEEVEFLRDFCRELAVQARGSSEGFSRYLAT